jgi:hypothetical protein
MCPEYGVTYLSGRTKFLIRSGLRIAVVHSKGVAEMPAMTPDDAKALSLLFLRDTDKFATHILDKSWLLFETKPDTPL